MMKKINDIIGDAKTIGIAGHVRPDGDCMGSCIGTTTHLFPLPDAKRTGEVGGE